MPKPGPPYPPEFRAEAVGLLRSSGRTVAELSRELGVSEQTLRRWRRQAGDDRAEATAVTDPLPSVPEGEVRRRRFTPNHQRKDRPLRTLARLTAEVIEAGVTVVTAPAKWAAKGLHWYADRKDEPPKR